MHVHSTTLDYLNLLNKKLEMQKATYGIKTALHPLASIPDEPIPLDLPFCTWEAVYAFARKDEGWEQRLEWLHHMYNVIRCLYPDDYCEWARQMVSATFTGDVAASGKWRKEG